MAYDVRFYLPYTASTQSFYTPSLQFQGVRETWERTEGRYGFDTAFCSIYGTVSELAALHQKLLGYEVRELVGAQRVYEGFVTELILHHQGLARVVGYDVAGGMFNAVRAAYRNNIENGEFDIDGAGPPTFQSWTEQITGSDTITKETTAPAKQSQSCRITNVSSGNTYVSQAVTVEEKTDIRVSFVTAGDGTVSGRYRIRDVTNGADITAVTSANVTGTNYKRVTEEIVVPNGCTSIRLYLYASTAAGYAIFDSVRIERRKDGRTDDFFTDWSTENSSIARHGRRERTLDGGNITPSQADDMRDAFLNTQAWPREKQTNGAPETRLDIYCLGYIHRAGWLETDSDVDGVTDSVTNHFTTIVNKLPWLGRAIAYSNTDNVTMPETTRTLADALRTLADFGDSSGNMWRIYISKERDMILQQVSFTPTLAQSRNKIYRAIGDKQTVDDRLIKAMSVIRNYDFPDSSELPTSLFEQRRDSLLEQVTVGTNGLRREFAEIEL